jgi:hypothetical protein
MKGFVGYKPEEKGNLKKVMKSTATTQVRAKMIKVMGSHRPKAGKKRR